MMALVWACLTGRALALDKAAPASAEASAEAPLVVYNRTVTVFRATFLGVSPENRARRAALLVRELVGRAGAGNVTVQIEPQVNVLLIDGELAFVLTAADADLLHGQTLVQASTAARDALQQVLADTRESRDVQRQLRGALNILLASLAAALVLVLIWKLRRWAIARLASRLEQRAMAVRVAGAQLVQTDRLVAMVSFGVRLLSWVVVAMVAYQWLSFAMLQFPYTRPWGLGLANFLFDVATHLGAGVLGALPDLVIAVAIFFIARAVIAVSHPFFSRVAASVRGGAGWLDADTARPTQRLFSVAVWVFALVMAYPYLPGADSEAFKGMSLLLGLMATIGGSSVLGQAASGLVLMYSRTLRVGEYVRISEHEGTVTEMGAFTTRVRTGLGEELTLPNSLVLGTVTKNYSRVVKGRGFVLDTTVTIGYDTPWRQVEAMLIEAARRTEGVMDEPEPRVFQVALSDFYPEYRLVCQASATQPRPRAEVLSALHANVQDVFNEYGVQIMSPHYLGDPAAAKVVPRQAWHTAPAQPADDAGAGRDDVRPA